MRAKKVNLVLKKPTKQLLTNLSKSLHGMFADLLNYSI